MLARSLSGGTCPTDTSAYRRERRPPGRESGSAPATCACFALRVDFSGPTQTRNPQVIDFLPPGFELRARVRADLTGEHGHVHRGRHPRPRSPSPSGPASAFGRYVPPGAVFEVVLQARVLRVRRARAPRRAPT